MKNKKQISILGSGWLGIPLAETLISKGYKIKSSTTSIHKVPLLKEKGIEPYVFTLGNKKDSKIIKDFITESDFVIVNFPPKRKNKDIETVYPQQVKHFISCLPKNIKILFVSSTSVYPTINNWVTEETKVSPERNAGKAIVKAEQLLMDEVKDRLTILRFSGLIGYNRKPGRFLAGKTALKNGKSPVNLIHRDDCIGLIIIIVENNYWNEIFNGCADLHPSREEFYTAAAKQIGVPPPTFLETEEISFKLVSNTKSKKILKYTYKHPNPLDVL